MGGPSGRAAVNAASGMTAAHRIAPASNARRNSIGKRIRSRLLDRQMESSSTPVSRGQLIAVGLTSGTLLMTELALTRIFSVVMYYHFAFLAISIALFGVSASGVFAYVTRRRFASRSTDSLLAVESLIYAAATIVALFFLVRLR